MFDVGMGEFLVIAIIGVLLLGPERLPRAIAEGTRWLRALRDQAANARREIADAADFDPEVTAELRRSMSDLAELHPRRLASSILSDVGTAGAAAGAASDADRAAPPAAPAPVNPFGASAQSSSFDPRPTDAVAPPTPGPAPAFDPDAT